MPEDSRIEGPGQDEGADPGRGARPDGPAAPLPRDWLPEAAPAEGAPEWELGVRRIVAAAEARLLASRQPRTTARPPAGLGDYMIPGAALAAAAALVLALGLSRLPRQPASGGLILSVVAGGGSPDALWRGLGVDADPVLALIALEAGGDLAGADGTEVDR